MKNWFTPSSSSSSSGIGSELVFDLIIESQARTKRAQRNSDAKAEDRCQEESWAAEGEAEGHLPAAVPCGPRQAPFQHRHDLWLLPEVPEEQSILLLLWKCPQDPFLCQLWENQMYGIRFRLRRPPSRKKCHRYCVLSFIFYTFLCLLIHLYGWSVRLLIV